MMDHCPQDEEDLVPCRICLQTFKEPKALPCVHRLCDSCLGKHISISPTRDTDGLLGFACPDCREFIPVLDTSNPASSRGDQFNADALVKRLFELYTSRQEVHNNNVPHISHPCPEHTDTEVDLYCVGCSEAVCHLCATTRHQHCDRLLTVNKAAQDLRSLLQDKIDQVLPVIEQSLEREKVRQSCVEEVQEKVKLAETEISESARIWHQCVNEQKKLLVEELHKNYRLLQQNVSAKAFNFTGQVNKLQDLVNMARLKMMSSSDLDMCLDTSYIGALSVCKEKCLDSHEQYDDLCKDITDVTCRFETSSSVCISLGNILFLSNIHDVKGSDDRTPSTSQMSSLTVGPMSPPPGSHTFMSSPGSMSQPISSHTIMSSLEPVSPPPSSHSLISLPEPMSQPPGSHTLRYSLRPMSAPSSSHTLMSLPRPMSAPPGSHTNMSPQGPMSPLSSSHTLMSSPRPMSAPPSSHTLMSSPRPMSPQSSSHTLMSSPRPMSPQSSSHTLMPSPRPMSAPPGSLTLMSSPRPMSRYHTNSTKYDRNLQSSPLGLMDETFDSETHNPVKKKKK